MALVAGSGHPSRVVMQARTSGMGVVQSGASQVVGHAADIGSEAVEAMDMGQRVLNEVRACSPGMITPRC